MSGTAVRLRVDGLEAAAGPGERLRELLGRLGVRPEGLCETGGLRPSVSCMACLVRDAASGRFLAPCEAPAEAGMAVETRGPEVEELRRAAVELLLSEHVGDCEAPCRRACPAGIDVSAALWHLGAGDEAGAAAVFTASAPFPAILGRVCGAPCERACRRAPAGGPVSIRGIERHLGDALLRGCPPPAAAPESGRRAAVVGGGLLGLCAAWQLRRDGHGCTLLDAGSPEAGLLEAGPPGAVPPEVAAAEAARVAAAGVRFEAGARIGRDFSAGDLAAGFDAVILALPEGSGEALPDNVIRALRPGAPAPGPARSAALGRRAAQAAGVRLAGGRGGGGRRFDSVVRGFGTEDLSDLLAAASARARRAPSAGGYSAEEARGEAARCLRCDCRKKERCRLRAAADAVGARPPPPAPRPPLRREAGHPEVVFEPGKCIRCGVCAQVTEAAGEPLGLGLRGRGRDLRVAPPFGESLAAALRVSAGECVRQCPTGALSLREENP